MNKTKLLLAVTITFLFLTSGPVTAVKPGNSVNPNGFPSGPHYNLNLIGKKAGFSCPAGADYELSDRNVIFVPDSGTGIKIYIQSGKGKKFEDIDQLQVTDWCAFDTNGATFQLPKHDAGYGVYIRVLAKHNNDPDNDPYIDNIMAQLVMAEDENGNQLVYLGEIEEGWIQTYNGQIFRHKGKSRAVEITDLFMFSGTICTILPDAGLDPNLCCFDEDDNGIYDYCMNATDSECDGAGVAVYGECEEYTAEDRVWIFNLGEIVDLLWQFDNNGVKTTQIRFYPR
jgi:hypothetical protein